jgi:putative addiction module killer protein
LRDAPNQRRLVLRVRKAALGNLGDVKSVGHGVFEMREAFGPGWRMYYIRREDSVILMLGGGTKATQTRDIAKAIALAATIEEV